MNIRIFDVRKIDVEKIISELLPANARSPHSLIIQGLPGSGCEYIYGQVVEQLQNDWCNNSNNKIIRINLTSHWIYPVAHLVQTIITDVNNLLGQSIDLSGMDIDLLLLTLRERVTDFSKKNGVILFCLDNFDLILKFDDPVGIQHFLNTLQSIGYDPSLSASFLIKCYRDIEDICRSSNYSDFYKIFGLNHYIVKKPSEKLLKESLVYSGLDEKKWDQVIRICAGIPEHIQLILESRI